MKSLLAGAIHKRQLVLFVFAIIAAAGIFSLDKATVDAIPDIGENQQIVFTEWPGRSPKDIELQLTYPLSVGLQGIPGVKSVRGISAFGFSTIYVIFDDDIDFYWSRSRVLEKISTSSSELPSGVRPVMGPDATGLGQIYWYTIENKIDNKNPLSLAELRSIQDFTVKYQLQSVKGVSEVASIGGFVKEYQIDVDPQKLFAFDIHFNKLVQAIQRSNIDVGAEVIEDGSREFLVRGLGFFESLTDIEDVVVAIKNKTPIRVKDLARISTGPGFRRGALDKNGQETVGGLVTMRFGENPARVIEAVKKRLIAVNAALPEGVELKPFYDRTQLIEKTLGTVYQALTEEIIITIIVISLFLLHFRASILVCLTLPFGVGISFILMYVLDIDSNIMSLSGLVIAIGSMVDMGIIVTENIYTGLSEHPGINNRQRLKVIIEKTQEVGPAILIAVATTIVTFLPVFALQGSAGKLFGPLAWAKTLAMAGSVIVALFLIPALSYYFLRGELKPIEKNKLSTWLITHYRKTLDRLLDHWKLFAIAPALLILFGWIAYLNLGREFMPALNEGDILYMPVTTNNVSITKARELLSYTDKILIKHPLVENVVGKLGRAETALDPAPISMFETIVKLKNKSDWPSGTTIQDIMQELDESLQIPGVINSWDFPIQTRIGMISTGIKTQVGVKIFGNDIRTLEKLAAQVGDKLKEVSGASGIYAEKIAGKPYIEFKIDRKAASRFGINTGDINDILQTAVGGMTIGQFIEGRERYPIRVRYKKELRDSIEKLKTVLVPSPMGQHIPLVQLAKINITIGPAAINSENGMLRSVVLLNVVERDLVGFVEEAKLLIEKSIQLPKGYSIHWAGQFENQIKSSKRLALLIPLALLINLALIFWGIQNLSHSLIIFTAIPVALSGGLIFLWLGGFDASVAVWVGFIALFGIAVDDGVVLMSYLRQELARVAPTNWSELKGVILDAGSRRIRPLIMTTNTTIVALLPVMWSSSIGSEVIKPMALPVLGGMAFEFITLFMVPISFALIERRKFNI